jgi:apolipoprotein N-acyltransferase
MVIAANTGISAWIDGSGQILARGSRMTADQLLAEPSRDSRWGLFQTVRDWPVRIIALLIGLIYVIGVVQPKYFRKETETTSQFSDSTQPA